MRLGLLGLGRIGEFHADTLASLPMADSLVADIIPSLTKKVAERLRAEPAASPDALLKSGLDGVVIAASTDAHPELIVAAVDAGLPVFCEKPLARTIAEGVEVLQRVQAAGVPRADRLPAAPRRRLPGRPRRGRRRRAGLVAHRPLDDAGPRAPNARVRRRFRGHLPRLRRPRLRHHPLGDRPRGGRGLRHRQQPGAEFFAAHGDVDTSAAVLTLDDSTLALVSNTRYNPRGYDVRLEVHGSKDSIAVGLEKKLPLRSVEPLATFPTGVPHRMFMDRFLPAYQAELEVFAELVAGDRVSPCTVADALAADLIAEACGLSLREHRPVRIDEVKP